MNFDTIHFGSRNNSFKTLIESVLKKTKLKKDLIDLLLSNNSLESYNDAFTSETVNNIHNYQV